MRSAALVVDRLQPCAEHRRASIAAKGEQRSRPKLLRKPLHGCAVNSASTRETSAVSPVRGEALNTAPVFLFSVCSAFPRLRRTLNSRKNRHDRAALGLAGEREPQRYARFPCRFAVRESRSQTPMIRRFSPPWRKPLSFRGLHHRGANPSAARARQKPMWFRGSPGSAANFHRAPGAPSPATKLPTLPPQRKRAAVIASLPERSTQWSTGPCVRSTVERTYPRAPARVVCLVLALAALGKA